MFVTQTSDPCAYYKILTVPKSLVYTGTTAPVRTDYPIRTETLRRGPKCPFAEVRDRSRKKGPAAGVS